MTVSNVLKSTKGAGTDGTSLPSTGLLAGLGAVIGLGALAASSCCALPLALAGLGAGGAVFSGLDALVSVRPLLLAGAAIALAVAWTFYYRRRNSVVCGIDDSCAAPTTSTRTLLLLSAGTTIVGLALAWNAYVEPWLLKLAR